MLEDRSVHTPLAHSYALQCKTGTGFLSASERLLRSSPVVAWPGLVIYLDLPQEAVAERNPGKFPPGSIYTDPDFNAAVRTYSWRLARRKGPRMAWLDCDPGTAGTRAARRGAHPARGRTGDHQGGLMDQVPLSGRVVFSDWHGMLSRDPFWTSIRNSATHPLHEQLEAGMAGVFDPARNTANEWMKGLLSSDQVIAAMGIQLRGRFTGDFLGRRLDLDCARMKVNVGLFEVLRVIRAEAMVVIATDNMDCFARAFERARGRGRRPGRDRETLADWAVICDDIICSSQAGMLKMMRLSRWSVAWSHRPGRTIPRS